MDLDDEMCLCFHVTRRKVENFVRQTQPQRPNQLSECFGAGTGCGWCRPFLRRVWQNAQLDQASESRPPADPASAPLASTDESAELPSATQYASDRAEYRKARGLD